MKLVAEAGTDAAAIVLFDPLALPEDFDERYKQDPREIADELELQGRFFYRDTEGDGDYLLHLYLDEAVPEELEKYTVENLQMDMFHVPGGRLWFTGAEYAFREDDNKYQCMGIVLEIPKGTYRVHAMRMEYPEGYVKDRIKNSLLPQERRICQRNGEFVFAGCLFTLLTPAVVWMLAFAPSSLLLVPLLIAYWVYVYHRSNAPQYLAAVKKREDSESNYPSFIVEFHSL